VHPDSPRRFERPVENLIEESRSADDSEPPWLPPDRPPASRGAAFSGSQLGVFGGILLIPIGIVSPLPLIVRYLIVAMGVVLIVASASGKDKAGKRVGVTVGVMVLLPLAALVFLFAVCTFG
jgi:hypothetical protein